MTTPKTEQAYGTLISLQPPSLQSLCVVLLGLLPSNTPVQAIIDRG